MTESNSLDLASSVCDLGASQGGLSYRGDDVAGPAGHSTYEETAFVLLHACLPARAALREFGAEVRAGAKVPAVASRTLRAAPRSGDPVGLLQVAVATLAAEESFTSPTVERGGMSGARPIGRMAGLVAAIHRLRQHQRPLAPRAGLSLAGNVLYMMRGALPVPAAGRGFDAALIVRADNEFIHQPSPLASPRRPERH
ncbi:MAG: citrate/2-methylcitrate synthase [Gemmatimonadota bacterium]